MPTRVIEVGAFTVCTLFIVLFLFVSGLTSAPVARETVLMEEIKAKQLYLALDNLPSTNSSLAPGTSVTDLVRLYYMTGDERYLDAAKNDIRIRASELLDNDSVWRVYTADGALDLSSPFFGDARIRGSASAPLLNATELIVITGR